MKRSRIIISIALVTLLLALGSGLQVYFRVSFFMVILLTITLVWNSINIFKIRAEGNRVLGKRKVGDIIQSEVVIENTSWLPKFGLEVKELEELPGHNTGFIINLPPLSKRSMLVQIPLMKRGIYRVGMPSVYTNDPLDVFRFKKRLSGAQELLVLPYTVDISPFSLSQADIVGDGTKVIGSNVSVASVSTVREYQPGDSARYIHWPATARKNTLMLKQFDSGSEDITWILLDLDANVQEGGEIENTEEYSVSIAASIAKTYAELGWEVGLICQGNQQYLLKPQSGYTNIDSILWSLTDVKAEGNVPLNRLYNHWRSEVSPTNVSLIVITSSTDLSWVELLVSSMLQGVSPAVVLVDPMSFDSERDLKPLASQLNAKGVPVYLVSKGGDIAESLKRPWYVTGDDYLANMPKSSVS